MKNDDSTYPIVVRGEQATVYTWRRARWYYEGEHWGWAATPSGRIFTDGEFLTTLAEDARQWVEGKGHLINAVRYY